MDQERRGRAHREVQALARDFAPVSQIATGCLEGALFAGCIAGAMIIALYMPIFSLMNVIT